MIQWKFCALLVAVGMLSRAFSAVAPTDLRCEYLENPLGVDDRAPRLSWLLKSVERGARQTAYQLQVASNLALLKRGKADLWDTGRVVSTDCNQIAYLGKPLLSRTRCVWQVRTWDEHGQVSPWSPPASWTVGLANPKSWHSQWIGLADPTKTESGLATPRYLRHGFIVNASRIRRATVYATALGLYELRINGQRVGDHLLAPEWTDYFKRVQYQTYDVTGLVRTGSNAIGAILGNGWYSGDWQHWESKLRPIYGDQPYLKVQLEIEDSAGHIQVIGSGPEWHGTTDGPLRFSGIYEGETYDARREMPGWDRPGFDDTRWRRASVESPKVGAIEWQRSPPIQVTQRLPAISVSEPKPGVYVFDLGQNIAGWSRMHLHEPANTQVTLKFNEVLNPDGTVYMDNLHAGHLSTGDRQIDRYTCDGRGEETFEPHFTYHGFRYVEVSGLTRKPSPNDLTACVFHTGFRKTGEFSCSEPLLNRLALNIQWSQRANMMGVPTDCCQRDERCGYTGDAQFFVPTAVYNFDVAAFFNKWLVDVCEDSQMPNGCFADHAPTFGPGNHWNVGWSDAGIICPYNIWQAYGDTRVIREHYAAMKRKLDLLKRTSPTFVHTAPIGNGDWLNLGGGASDSVIGTAYDAYDYRLMSEMARAIGETRDAAEFKSFANQFSAAFARTFIDQDGKIRDSSQTGFALAYTMNLLPRGFKPRMTNQFSAEISRFDNHLATGFIGTPRLLPALHLAGRDDLAYKILLQKTYPSWLYQVKLGATTMWERWDGWRPEKGFQDSGMNSFNHYAFGSVGQYLYGMIGGIEAEAPGYRKIRIAPVIEPGLSWANVSFDSIQGTIRSSWRTSSKHLTMDIDIPANTSAKVWVPTRNRGSVTESGRPITNRNFVRFVGLDGSSAVYQVQSGHYHFVANR